MSVMSVVREYVQWCGHRDKIVASEISCGTNEEAESCLERRYRELKSRQEEWPGVWSYWLGDGRYTIDNNDGDFFEGRIVAE